MRCGERTAECSIRAMVPREQGGGSEKGFRGVRRRPGLSGRRGHRRAARRVGAEATGGGMGDDHGGGARLWEVGGGWGWGGGARSQGGGVGDLMKHALGCWIAATSAANGVACPCATASRPAGTHTGFTAAHNSSSHLRPELAEARRAPSRIMGCENIRKSFVTVLALFMVGRFCFLPSCQASVTVTQL